MSAVVVHIGSQSVHVLTDTAALTATGKVGHFASKIALLPHANMAIAGRGHAWVLPLASDLLQREGATFDDIKSNAARVLKAAFMEQPDPTLVNAVNTLGLSQDAEIVVAGISEGRGPCAYMMRVSQHGDTLNWSYEEIEGEDAMWGAFTPEIEAEFERRAECRSSGRLGQLGWLFEQFRRTQAPVFGRGDAVSQVGGHAVLTRIRRGAIETSILRTWPDVVGERIVI